MPKPAHAYAFARLAPLLRRAYPIFVPAPFVLTPARRFELIALFGLLTVFTPIAVDLYMPAFPAMAREFGTPVSAVEHSLASYFLGLAIGQAAIGPLSDRFGRRRPLLIGMGLYVFGSVACALAPNPLALDGARVVQALGGCAAVVLARASVRDIFPPGEAARVFAQMLLVLSVSPLFAPLVGGWLLLVASWRAGFWIQAGSCLLTMVLVFWRLPESHPGSDRTLHPIEVARDYLHILGNRHFYGYIVPVTLSLGGLYVWLTGFSHVAIDMFGISPQHFGYFFFANGIGFVTTSQIVARLLKHRPARLFFSGAITIQAVAGLIALVVAWGGWGGLWGFVPFTFLYCCLIGVVNSTGGGLAMVEFGHSAGMASALMGLVLYGGATLASMAMGAVDAQTPVPMTLLMGLCGLAALAAAYKLKPFRPAQPSAKAA
ncbi:MAG: multidrug effflux MFS transporter [Alphaproteobacteria bacterium]|nr:multidrug effflux MFS transporter [Alphaproteobacteria bacterium]